MSVQLLNSASNQIPLWADTLAWRLSVGLFHRIKETEEGSGGQLVHPFREGLLPSQLSF